MTGGRTPFAAGLLLPLALALACSPARIVRMGPPVGRRPAGCGVEVLKAGAKPSRPYRDVGMVELPNCQDFLQMPCRKWLVDAACTLGGHVAYLPEPGGGPVLDTAPVLPYEGGFVATGTVTFRVLVAAYVAELDYRLEDDVVYRSRVCSPACKEGERCVDGACRRPEDCDEAAEQKAEPKAPDAFVPERCTE